MTHNGLLGTFLDTTPLHRKQNYPTLQMSEGAGATNYLISRPLCLEMTLPYTSRIR